MSEQVAYEHAQRERDKKVDDGSLEERLQEVEQWMEKRLRKLMHVEWKEDSIGGLEEGGVESLEGGSEARATDDLYTACGQENDLQKVLFFHFVSSFRSTLHPLQSSLL